MKKQIIEPRSLSGVMELLPSDQILFNQIKNTIEETYEEYGFLPLDTPVIESADVLLAKAGGETEKQIYKFSKGENDICLRFDLTVPLAKYVAANQNNLTFPFKRYQIGKVYRGERPQKGRYREFYQCDIDIVGKDELSIKNDAEIPSIIYNIFKKLNFGKFTIYLNNRKILAGLLESMNLQNLSADVLRIIDKYEKIGASNVELTLLEDLKLTKEQAITIMNFIQIKGATNEKLESLRALNIENERFLKGVAELEEVVTFLAVAGVPQEYFEINLSIARGLDYYTGTIYETFLDDFRELGSVCSGGRYDNLSDFYSENKFPGVGISIGLTRLFYKLQESNLIHSNKKSIADVLVLPMDNAVMKEAFEVASELRSSGIKTEIYLEETAKFKTKMAYADKLNIPFAIILGEDEVKSGTVTLKNMALREQNTVTLAEVINKIKNKK